MPRERSSYFYNLIHLKAWAVLWDSNMQVAALGALYFTSLLGISSAHLGQKAIILLSSLGSALLCGALINDYCDIEADRAAGKKRTIYYIPKLHIVALILVAFFTSQAITWLIISDPLYISAYSIWYLIGVFYSAPPLRFKARGAAGILSNILIEKFFPILLGVIFFRFYGWEGIPLLAFSLIVQVEIIAHHQVLDYDADLKTKTGTYAVSEGLSPTLLVLKYSRPLLLASGILVILVLSVRTLNGFILPAVGLLGYIASRVVVKPRDPSVPYPISYLTIFLHGVVPLYLALLASLHSYSFTPLLILVTLIQYPLVKKYTQGFKSLLGAIRNRMNVTVR